MPGGYIWKKLKKLCKNNKVKILSPMCNGEFELPDGSYSVSESDIQYYFRKYILEKYGKNAYNIRK